MSEIRGYAVQSPTLPLEITKLKPKSISPHWKFMFTRARYETADMVPNLRRRLSWHAS
jgi:hypothetical protein